MKITLLHPSRGRAVKAFDTMCEWLKLISGKHEISHILSLDKDDTEVEDYKKLFAAYSSVVVVSNNKNVVQATNTAAMVAQAFKPDVLIYLSDDFKCPMNWDDLIYKKILDQQIFAASFPVFGSPWLLKVDDCLQKFDIAVLTIPIMSTALYNKLGYFWHPGYKSMFVDEDLYWTCKNNGWMVMAPELKFPHEHCSVGKCENDETYKRSAANWDQGKALFAERKKLNFPL